MGFSLLLDNKISKLIVQWGWVPPSSEYVYFNFPVAYSTSVSMALAKYSTTASGQTMAQTWLGLSEQPGLTRFKAGVVPFTWLAIGT